MKKMKYDALESTTNSLIIFWFYAIKSRQDITKLVA